MGLWGKFILGPYISLIAENSTNAPYVLIGTGTTIIVFGLFGCFATCRGSPWMLKLVSLVSGSTFYIKWCPKTNRERVSLALSFSSTPCSCLWCSWPSWSLASRALFSVMRWDVHTHILRRWPLMRLRDLHLSRTRRACSSDIWQSACVCVCVFTQIKGTFMRTYNEAIQNYNAQDERSIAVDNVQRSVRSNTG